MKYFYAFTVIGVKLEVGSLKAVKNWCFLILSQDVLTSCIIHLSSSSLHCIAVRCCKRKRETTNSPIGILSYQLSTSIHRQNAWSLYVYMSLDFIYFIYFVWYFYRSVCLYYFKSMSYYFNDTIHNF